MPAYAASTLVLVAIACTRSTSAARRATSASSFFTLSWAALELELLHLLAHGGSGFRLVGVLLGGDLVLGLDDRGQVVRLGALAQQFLALDVGRVLRGQGDGEGVQLLRAQFLGHQGGRAARLDREIALDRVVRVELHVPVIQTVDEGAGDAVVVGQQVLHDDGGGGHQHRHAGRGAGGALGGVLALHVARDRGHVVRVPLEHFDHGHQVFQPVRHLSTRTAGDAGS
jgi:hypothetical protein